MMISMVAFLFSLFTKTRWEQVGVGWVLSMVFLWKLSSGSHFSAYLGLHWDEISVLVVTMTFAVFSLMMLVSPSLNSALGLVFLSLAALVFLIFSVTRLLLFYVLFEVSLVPMLLMILGWGGQPERLVAGLYMFFYTLVSSLPFLGLVIYYWGMDMTLSLSWGLSTGESILLIAPFAVKMPMMYLHLWLPKAHVEAPVFGSMILAATLLKIGSYGVWRLGAGCNENALEVFAWVSLAGGAVCSVITLAQSDIKSLIAYSSVVHMGMLFSCVLLGTTSAVVPALMMMIAHGICSSGLFSGCTICYERFSTRNISLMQGMMAVAPSLAFPWVLLILANLSAPPSLGLLSEVLMLSTIVSISMSTSVLIGLMVILVLAYSLVLFFNLFHGQSSLVIPESSGSVKEMLVLHSQALFGVGWPLCFWLF